MVSVKPVVGILSKEHPESYQWLTTFLSSLPEVKDVLCTHLPGNNSPHFREEVSQYDFVVFYTPKHMEKESREEERWRGQDFVMIAETEPPYTEDLALVSDMIGTMKEGYTS